MDAPVKNVLFDLYGTLVDIRTDEKDAAVWRKLSWVLSEQGARWEPERLRERYESGVRRLEAEAREALSKEGALSEDAWPEIDLGPIFAAFYTEAGVGAAEAETARLAWTFRVLTLRRLELFPGARGLLRELRARGRRVYLLSNAQALFTKPELRILRLDALFDGVLLSSDAGRKKPDQAFFQMLLERYGLDPHGTVMVGNDDIADCHGAHGAGLRSFYVQTEQSPPKSGPLPEDCRVLETISELIRYV